MADLRALPREHAAVFVVATSGQGEFPANCRALWRFLARASLPAGCLSGLRVAVFGFGDSGYPLFNAAARKLFRRLVDGLGAAPLLPLGLGDDQAGSGGGPDAALDAWLRELWPALRATTAPLPAGVPEEAWGGEGEGEVGRLGPCRFSVELVAARGGGEAPPPPSSGQARPDSAFEGEQQQQQQQQRDAAAALSSSLLPSSSSSPVECPVCLEVDVSPTDAVLFPCGHATCRACHAALLGGPRDPAFCPLCRAPLKREEQLRGRRGDRGGGEAAAAEEDEGRREARDTPEAAPGRRRERRARRGGAVAAASASAASAAVVPASPPESAAAPAAAPAT